MYYNVISCNHCVAMDLTVVYNLISFYYVQYM